MTPNEIRQAVMNHISSNLASIYPSFTTDSVAWPNTKFDPDDAPGSIWLEPIIRITGFIPGEKGEKGVAVRNGLLMLRFFVPVDTGAKTSATLTSNAEGLFSARIVDEIIFDHATPDDKGPDGRGYYQSRVDVPFWTFVNE